MTLLVDTCDVRRTGTYATGAPHTRPEPRMRGVKNLLTGRTASTTSPIRARSHGGKGNTHADDTNRTQADDDAGVIRDQINGQSTTYSAKSNRHPQTTRQSALNRSRPIHNSPTSRDTPKIFRPEGQIPAEGAARMSDLRRFGGHPLSDFDIAGALNA